MASINRTIYPQLSEPKDKFEWRARYDLATSEIALAKEHARGINRVLAFLVLLKTFQNIGYFVEFTHVPTSIVNHMRDQLLDNWRGEKAQLWENLRLSEPTLYEYRDVIREYRGVKIYSASGPSRISVT
ncbi:MAG: DUF4158 domain-containing protein, partial [Anaerolineae bacterium]|nr:DUF4158 domain-containing protein [Anaerolineae bacterium]